MRIVLSALALWTLAGPLRAAEDHGFWWYQEAKLACMGDVMRLCREYVPDEDRVRACMQTKKALVSQGCAEFYPGGKKAD